jgi:hypothetical protein
VGSREELALENSNERTAELGFRRQRKSPLLRISYCAQRIVEASVPSTSVGFPRAFPSISNALKDIFVDAPARARPARLPNGPAERSMQCELSRVVIRDGPQVLPLRIREGLNRLQHFDWKALAILNPLDVSIVGRLSRGHRFLSAQDLLTP